MTAHTEAPATLKEMKDDGRPWVLMRFLPPGYTSPTTILKRCDDRRYAQITAEQAATVGAWRDDRVYLPGRSFMDAMIVTLREVQCEAFADPDVHDQACKTLGIEPWRS